MIALAWLVTLAILAAPTGFFWCCCAPPCTGELCVLVRASGCMASGDGIAGATVAVSQGGVLIGTCVTGSGGTCCVALTTASPTGGTYSVTVTPPDGTCLNSGTVSGITADCTITNNTTVTLTVQSTCVCTSCCPYPIAKALTLTDAGGSVDFTYRSGELAWQACHPIDGLVCTNGTACEDRTILVPVSGTTCVQYSLECSGGDWTLTAVWRYVSYWKACEIIEGIDTFSDWGWGYWGGGSCAGDPPACTFTGGPPGTCSGFFDSYVVTESVTLSGGGLSVTCEGGTFSGTATLPSSHTDASSGISVPTPHGGTVTFSL